MYELTTTSQGKIDAQLQGKLEWAESNKLQAEQLALDATRLLSCTTDRLETYRDQGFFKRCWCSLSGKNDEMQKANQRDLVSMQQHAWRYINLLNERNILMAHSMITVKNNLMTLAVAEEETRSEVRRMAEKVYERFVALEDRMKAVEVATSIHGWLITLDTLDYDDRFTPHFRLLRVVNDFIGLKPGDWHPQELRYLQKAVKEAGLPWKQTISVESFVDGVIDEIEDAGYASFEGLLGNKNGSTVPVSFILDNVAVPTYTSLFSIADNYTKSSNTIDVLIEELSCSRIEAIKKVLMTLITRQGVDVSAEVPFRDLAIELLSCMRLSRALFASDEHFQGTPRTDAQSPEKTVVSGQANKDAQQLTEEVRDLLPEWTDISAAGIVGTAVGKVSDAIDRYIEDNSMDAKDFASYFSAEDIAEDLQEGIDEAVTEILEPIVTDIVSDEGSGVDGATMISGFRLAADEAMKPYLESIVSVEVTGAELVSKQSSIVDTVAKGIGVGALAGTLLGPVGIIGAIAANYMHDKSREKKAGTSIDVFNACVQKSLEYYDAMVESLREKTAKLLHAFWTDVMNQPMEASNVDDLKKILEAIREQLAEHVEAQNDDSTEDGSFIDAGTLLEVLKTFESEDYYVHDSIPPKKLVAAQSYPVSPGYDVLALIDATVFGSAKNGMAITPKGIYWSNGDGWLDTETEKNHMTWAELKAAENSLQVSKSDLVIVPGSPFDLAGSSVEPKELRRLLKKCSKLVK